MCSAGNSSVQTGERAAARRGTRCRICTGCGACPGTASGRALPEGLHVLSCDALLGERGAIRGDSRLAVADVGTTTLAMLLYDRDGGVADRCLMLNPQYVYGADVLSRIQAAEDRTTAADMREQVQKALEQGIRRFRGKLREGETLYLVLAANTAMTYLLMGWDPAELGRAPFRASRLDGARTEIGGVPCFVFPGLSAFVGGDIAAGICASGMCGKEAVTLLLDLGTNGEMVLGNRDKRIACATAAGPAFEGGASRGVWGADMISRLAVLLREKILDRTGLLAEPYFDSGIRIGNVKVTQEAVRSVQLAKGAIAAGIQVLLHKYGIGAEDVDTVILAGGFGYYLKPEDAVEIGLLPEALLKRTLSGGNTALTGCLMAGKEILSRGDPGRLKDGLREIINGTEVVNLAMEPEFEELYPERMNFMIF